MASADALHRNRVLTKAGCFKFATASTPSPSDLPYREVGGNPFAIDKAMFGFAGLTAT